MLAPSGQYVYTTEQQWSLFRSIISPFANKQLIIVVNKVISHKVQMEIRSVLIEMHLLITTVAQRRVLCRLQYTVPLKVSNG